MLHNAHLLHEVTALHNIAKAPLTTYPRHEISMVKG